MPLWLNEFAQKTHRKRRRRHYQDDRLTDVDFCGKLAWPDGEGPPEPRERDDQDE